MASAKQGWPGITHQLTVANTAASLFAKDPRGERLVVLYAESEMGPEEVRQKLSETGLPHLWLPKRDNIYKVDGLPTLGSGKLDLRAVKTMAQTLSSGRAAPAQRHTGA